MLSFKKLKKYFEENFNIIDYDIYFYTNEILILIHYDGKKPYITDELYNELKEYKYKISFEFITE